MTHDTPALRRALNLPLLTLYGLGVTVGAGIYVLIGVTVAQAGAYAWLSFLAAGVVVAFTAFSYAELSTRFPVSAGEAAYVDAGLGIPAVSVVVGLLVALAGLVSASAITIGASAYLGPLVGLSAPVLILGIALFMGVIAWWGILESVALAAVITLVEIGGLLIVILWGFVFVDESVIRMSDVLPPLGGAHWGGIAAASLLAFFAFVGFEDMVNVAEEVENPRSTMPRAIILTLVIALILYVVTCLAALRVVSIADLAGSPRPLALVFADAPQWLDTGFVGIAAIATVNGVLIQIIMAARVLYGMAARGQLPAFLAQLSLRRQTPTAATALVTACIIGLSLYFPIDRLAGWTSQIVLGIFVIVNIALVALKWRGQTGDFFTVPMAVPVLGIVTSLALFATMLL